MTIAAPEDVLAYWIGPAKDDPGALTAQNKLWFGKSDAVDRDIADRFLETLRVLANGLANDWASRGPQGRLAAIIVLDQFSRNLFRGLPDAFAQDRLALGLCKEGLVMGDDGGLSEVERVFFYLPLEHSERQADQALFVDLLQKLVKRARPAFRDYAERTLEYGHRHKAIIDRFGRFPHRNLPLGRINTPEEAAFLQQPGSGF